MQILLQIVDSPISVRFPDKAHASMKAGDVIVIKPDNHVWSERELTNPKWRIIKVDILRSQAQALTQNGSALGDASPRREYARTNTIDLTSLSLPAALRAHLQGDRDQGIFDMGNGRGALMAAVVTRPDPVT